MARRPRSLQPGDRIGLVCTAKRVPPAEIHKAIKIFERWNLNVVTGKHLYNEANQFAGTDEERLRDFQEMLNDTSIKAIVCARGGYGTTRILDQIDFSQFLQHPKWIVGFSDVTAIHCHLHVLGIESIHGTMPILFQSEGAQPSIESLRKLLFGEEETLTCPPHLLNRSGSCSSPIIGGNLSIVANLIGTQSNVDTEGKILFLEDIDEYLYHIDRMMVQLKRAGMLDNLAGLIVGHMTDMKDNPIPFGKDSYEIIHDHVKEYDYPVCFGFPVGHEADNLAIPCSRVCNLNITENEVTLEL